MEVEDRDQVTALLTAARAELARMPDVLAGLLGGLDAAAWRARPAPAEWGPVEIVCHLRDEETEDFGARLRVVAEGGRRFAPNDPERLAIERRYQDGSLAATERWSAILTIVVQPPRTPDALRKNPLGVFVNALNWSKELSQ